MAWPTPATVLLPALLAGQALAGPVTISVRDAAGAPVPGAVVYLEGGPAAAPAKPGPAAVIDQRDKAFVPEVTVVRTGAEVSIVNSDTVSHHVYSFAQPNAFELPLFKGGTRPSVRFEHPGVVTLGCNIHDSMVGYVVVVDGPHFAIADPTGTATLRDVAPGTYGIRAWSARLDPAKALEGPAVTVTAQPATVAVALGRRLRPVRPAGALAGGDY